MKTDQEKYIQLRGKAIKVLEGLAMAGLVSVAVLLSPQAAPKLLEAALRELSKRRRKKVFRDLKQKRLITILDKGCEKLIQITELGKRKLLYLKLRAARLRKRKWDKKYRIVLFDIPEQMKNTRDILRMKLKILGFYQLQKSAWVFPWHCKEEIDFIKEIFGIGPYVEYVVTDSLQCKRKVREHYSL